MPARNLTQIINLQAYLYHYYVILELACNLFGTCAGVICCFSLHAGMRQLGAFLKIRRTVYCQDFSWLECHGSASIESAGAPADVLSVGYYDRWVRHLRWLLYASNELPVRLNREKLVNVSRMHLSLIGFDPCMQIPIEDRTMHLDWPGYPYSYFLYSTLYSLTFLFS